MELLTKTCETEQMNVERILARTFVIVGGAFWVLMAWAAAWAYQGAPLTAALGNALVFAGGIAVIFVIGLFYEGLASVILAAGAVGIVVLGLISGWEAGLWATVFFFLMLPMFIAAALYALAARMQRICSL